MKEVHKIAVVAMQGDFKKHIDMLTRLGCRAYPARSPQEIEQADALILPGGESTTIGKLMARFQLDKAIIAAHNAGKPIYGTCAGLILMSRTVVEETAERGGQPLLGLLDAEIARNAFGRQIDSFEVPVEIPILGSDPFPAVFIRAPQIKSFGPQTEVLATYQGQAVLIKQGTLLGGAFHPELGEDDRLHRHFLSLIKQI